MKQKASHWVNANQWLYSSHSSVHLKTVSKQNIRIVCVFRPKEWLSFTIHLNTALRIQSDVCDETQTLKTKDESNIGEVRPLCRRGSRSLIGFLCTEFLFFTFVYSFDWMNNSTYYPTNNHRITQNNTYRIHCNTPYIILCILYTEL